MQGIRDAGVLLVLVLVLVSVRVAPVDSVVDVIPSAQAAEVQAAEAQAETPVFSEVPATLPALDFSPASTDRPSAPSTGSGDRASCTGTIRIETIDVAGKRVFVVLDTDLDTSYPATVPLSTGVGAARQVTREVG